MQPVIQPGGIERVQFPAAVLHEVHRTVFPAERLVVGALRHVQDAYVAEAVWDVTGKTSPGGCVADPEKLVAALAEMDSAGTVFGLLAHSHPGRTPRAARPSRKDLDAYAARLALGASAKLVGAVFAGNYIQFFGNVANLEVTGSSVRPVSGHVALYEFA